MDELWPVVPQKRTRVGGDPSHSGTCSTSFAISDVLPEPGSPVKTMGLKK